jgi:hypothetical protein
MKIYNPQFESHISSDIFVDKATASSTCHECRPTVFSLSSLSLSSLFVAFTCTSHSMQVTCDTDKLSRDTSIDLQNKNATKRWVELDFFQVSYIPEKIIIQIFFKKDISL